MTIWHPELDAAGPAYLAIRRALEADVRSGRLREGERLPTHRALAARLAQLRGWSPERVALLHEAALVHDVGKIGIPDAVLLKPGRLDAVRTFF